MFISGLIVGMFLSPIIIFLIQHIIKVRKDNKWKIKI